MIDYAPEMPSRNTIPHASSGSDGPYVALILGAGFSKCADLPLQAEFSRALLDNIEDDDLNRTITSALQAFLQLTFGWCQGDDLPSLEAIFTLIDLSANTGHNLGFSYPPKKLRALRRLLIYRVFSILDQRYQESKEIKALLRKLLGHGYHPAFVVLNWDIVLERHLENTAQGRYGIDYCVNEFPWEGGEATETGSMISLIKIHGSSNWVYCDTHLTGSIVIIAGRSSSIVIRNYRYTLKPVSLMMIYCSSIHSGSEVNWMTMAAPVLAVAVRSVHI